MKQLTKQIIYKMPFYYVMRKWVMARRQKKEMVEWERKGKPVPPPHIVKQSVLRDYSKRFGLRILVETGTFFGDMVEAMKADFDRIYSIELSKDLYDKAVRRFERTKNVELIHGDSGTEIGNVIRKIDQPTLFWLDGHYSGGVTAKGRFDTPIYEELAHILSVPDRADVIIIDDAHCFGTDPAYPSIEELKDFILQRRTNMDILVQDNSIIVTSRL